MTDTCPRCGTPRLGDSPFCHNCALDFRTVAPAEVPAEMLAEPTVCPRCYAPLYPGYSLCGNCGLDWRDPNARGPMSASALAWLAVAIAVGLIVVLLGSIAFVAAAVQQQGAQRTLAPLITPEPTPTTQGNVIRWFIGTGPEGLAAPRPYQAFVKAYNRTNTDGFTLKLEVVPNSNSYDTLKQEIAAGNAPDIIGPIYARDRLQDPSLFLDLTDEIARNAVDLTAWDSHLVDLFKDGGSRVALPFTFYPGYIWYNKDIFTSADLPALPTRVGDLYQGKTWDWNEVAAIAAQLTTDQGGKKSTQAGFDATKIATYGIDFQWADARRMASCFGAGSFVAADGRTAQVPAVWNDAFSWYYDAVWTKHIAPDVSAQTQAYLDDTDSMASGHLAMSAAWPWSLTSIADSAATSKVARWDLAVMPSWKGVTTAPLDADTFVIARATRHPDAAFKAMMAIESSPEIMAYFGGIPARTADQDAYFSSLAHDLDSIFPGNTVTWSVMTEMAKYPAVPNHEAPMPNGTRSVNDVSGFFTRLGTKSGLNVTAELTALQTALQADFDGPSSDLPST